MNLEQLLPGNGKGLHNGRDTSEGTGASSGAGSLADAGMSEGVQASDPLVETREVG